MRKLHHVVRQPGDAEYHTNQQRKLHAKLREVTRKPSMAWSALGELPLLVREVQYCLWRQNPHSRTSMIITPVHKQVIHAIAFSSRVSFVSYITLAGEVPCTHVHFTMLEPLAIPTAGVSVKSNMYHYAYCMRPRNLRSNRRWRITSFDSNFSSLVSLAMVLSSVPWR